MNMRVLVVEDHNILQELLHIALEDEGYEVLLAHDGLEALEQMRTVRPDLILLDLSMPPMDGYQFINELDRQGRRSAIPIIVLSAYPVTAQDLAQMHVSAYFPKPFFLDTLLEKVRQCICSPIPLA